MVSMKARYLRLLWRLRFRNFDANGPVEELREYVDSLSDKIPLPPSVGVQPIGANGVDANWITPTGVEDDRVILYLHGGTYSAGSCRSHRGLIAHISAGAGARAIVPEYRLAPEHPYPAAVEDAVIVYHWLLDNGVEPGRVVVAADSAGAGVALSMLLSLRRQGVAMPVAAALISPWVDLSARTEATRRHRDPCLRPELLDAFARDYAGDVEPSDPQISPVFADLSGLPPLLVQAGDSELLLSDAARLVDRARLAGVEADLRIWQGMWSVWHLCVGRMPESAAAIGELALYIRGRLAPKTTARAA